MAIFAVYVIISYNAEIKNAELSYKNILKTYYNLVSTYKSDDFNETKLFLNTNWSLIYVSYFSVNLPSSKLSIENFGF